MVSLHQRQDLEPGITIPAAVLETFPGPVLLFDTAGALVSARPHEGTLFQSVSRGNLPEINEWVTAVLRGLERGVAEARTASVQTDGVSGAQSYDLTIIPCCDLAGAVNGVVVLARDVTLQHNLRSALVESRQRYKDFVETSSDFAWETGADGLFIFISPRGALGHAAAELVGHDPTDLVMEFDAGTGLPFSARVQVEGQEVQLRRIDGSTACVEVSARPVYDRSGRWVGARGVGRDVSSNRARDLALKRARHREETLNHVVRTFRDVVDPKDMLRVAVETIARRMEADSCHIFRRQGSVRGGDAERALREGRQTADIAAGAMMSGEAAPGGFGGPAGSGGLAAARMADTDDEEVGDDYACLATPPAFQPCPAALVQPSAAVGPVQVDMAGFVLRQLEQGEALVEEERDGYRVLAAACTYHHQMNGAVLLWRTMEQSPWGADERLLVLDIASQVGIANEQIAAHEEVVRISRTDGLTGLFNRRAFFDDVERRYNRLRHARSHAALLYVDLDNFKALNDTRGHSAGDAALCLVRDLLQNNTRPTDLVARLGGDEFAVWLENADTGIAETKARVLLQVSADQLGPLSVSDERRLGMSIGVAVYDPAHPESLADLIARADDAMYTVKRRGKSGFAVAPPLPVSALAANEAAGNAAGYSEKDLDDVQTEDRSKSPLLLPPDGTPAEGVVQ